MESASIQYLVERRCKLSQVGGLLDSKGYGLATRKGTPYKELLDNAILQLLEGGTLHRLKVRWWKQKRGGGACDAKGGGGGVKPLGLANVAGVFLVTMIGCAIASVFAFLEFLYGTKQSAKDCGVTWAEEMRTELQFIFQCHGNTRELRGSDSSTSSSSQLSMEVPTYSRRRSSQGQADLLYKNRFSMVESPNSKKSESSHKSTESKSTKLGSEDDCEANSGASNHNPFQA